MSYNKSNPFVYTVVLNWNHLDDLTLTIKSFMKQDYPNMKIIISDNGSNDGSQEYIKNHYPKIILLENNDNLGWAAGNNVGIQYAIKNNAEYVLLANNDLYFEDKNIISTLVNDLIKLKEKGINIIGTNVNYFSQKDKSHNTGWIMFPKSVKKGKVYNEFRRNYNLKISNNYKIVDFVSGCFILIDSSIFDKIGLLDENFFIYGEETEFSLRAWSCGYGSAINKDLTIYHKVAATNKVGSPFSLYLKTRNVYYLLRKSKKLIQDINYFKCMYFYDFIKTFIKILIFPKKFNGSKLALINSIIRGLLDGVIFKRKGKKGIKFN